MCSGAGTAESARAVLQKIVMKYPPPNCKLEMDIRTVALWDSRFICHQVFFEWEFPNISCSIFYFPNENVFMYSTSIVCLSLFQNFRASSKPRKMLLLAIKCFLTITGGAVILQGKTTLCRIFSMTFCP